MAVKEAYVAAGFSGKGAAQSASRLMKTPAVSARIAELTNFVASDAMGRALVDREYVLRRLKENVERAMQVTPVLDSRGRPTGNYRYDGSVANRALELLGRELGMFRDQSDHTFEWSGDLSDLNSKQLATLMKALEQIAFNGDPEKIAEAKREAAQGIQ